ncbi:MAG: hypothetical protein LBQ88_12745 [Treponema sp.]|jgi:hypothetical protein|nr:hypothetical protein [Treponema sp.]
MNEQELRIKAIELALQTLELYPNEYRAAAFQGEKLISHMIVETSENYFAFLAKSPSP